MIGMPNFKNFQELENVCVYNNTNKKMTIFERFSRDLRDDIRLNKCN